MDGRDRTGRRSTEAGAAPVTPDWPQLNERELDIMKRLADMPEERQGQLEAAAAVVRATAAMRIALDEAEALRPGAALSEEALHHQERAQALLVDALRLLAEAKGAPDST